MLELLLIIFLIIFPLIAIFSFVSTVTTGVYDWSKNQTRENNYYEPEDDSNYYDPAAYDNHYEPVQSTKIIKPAKQSKSIYKRTKPSKPKKQKTDFSDYAGYPESFEDSEEFKQLLETSDFDVRDYLKKND